MVFVGVMLGVCVGVSAGVKLGVCAIKVGACEREVTPTGVIDGVSDPMKLDTPAG